MPNFADVLLDACHQKGTPLCVGLDPRWDSLPVAFRSGSADSLLVRATAYQSFCRRVLELVAPCVAVVKPQSAFFEACGPDGMVALLDVMRYANKLGLVTILDVKRNDIASTAEAYAEAAFNVYGAHAITINPYLGRDSIEPFLKAARPQGKGIFVLVRTSNPGAGEFQDLLSDGLPVYRRVGMAVEAWNGDNLGRHGYGDVGAVVGATNPQELRDLRQAMPKTLFLIPGYGAQGGTAADVAGAFKNSTGGIVNSARGILYPFKPDDKNWEHAIVAATERTKRDLGEALGRS